MVLGGVVDRPDAVAPRGQGLHVRDRLGAVEAGPGGQAGPAGVAGAGEAGPGPEQLVGQGPLLGVAAERNLSSGNR